jgi:hypothetical protein
MRTTIRRTATATAAAAVLTLGAALPAAAAVTHTATHHHHRRHHHGGPGGNGGPPIVAITDSHGVLTTAAPLTAGETLSAFGYATGTYTVVSVTAHGAVSLVVLSPSLPASASGEVVDFRA